MRPGQSRSFFKSPSTLLYLLLSVLLCGLALAYTAYSEHRRAREDYQRRMSQVVDNLARSAQASLDFRSRSILFLSAVPPIDGLRRAIAAGGVDPRDNSSRAHWQQRLEQIFTAFLDTNPDVFKARYIGVADRGRELIHVERRGGRVLLSPASELQQLEGADYLQAALRLPAGKIHVSDISLNREYGQVTEPHQPTVRIATPIYDEAGTVFGVVVINIDVTQALAALPKAALPNTQLYVTNTEGDFLVHPDPTQRFGFDLGTPHRWEDLFLPTAEPVKQLPERMTAYQLAGQQVYAVSQTVARQSDDPKRHLRYWLVVSDDTLQRAVNARLWSAGSAALGVLLFGLYLLHRLWLNTQRRLLVRAERLRLAAIVEHSIDAVISLDAEGNVTSCNRAASRLFGHDEATARGQSLTALLGWPVQRRDLPENDVAQEHVLRHQDGTLLDVEASVSPIRADDGSLLGRAVILRDIRPQKAQQATILQLNATLERQVQERTAQLEATATLQRAVVDQAGYAIIATDAQGTITLFNPEAERLLGYSAREMIGQHTPAVLHDAAELGARAAALSAQLGLEIAPGLPFFAASTAGGHSYEAEWTYLCKGGERLPVRLKVSPLPGVNGAGGGFLAIAIDQREALSRRQAMQQARELAEAASQAKGQFLANMSHELRTPMNAILGMLQLLRRTQLNYLQADYAGKAETSARMLLGIVNDVLDFSRIEAGKLVLEEQPFALDELLRELGVVLSAAIGGRDLELLFDIEPGVPMRLMGDAMRLRQVLLNLGGNAVKFTESGEVVLRVRRVVDAQGLGHLEFTLRDTGIGMTAAQCERVFNSFEQAETSVARRYGGTGLGLAISQRLVHLMGGALTLESEPGVGSEFRFSLPLPAALEQPLRNALPTTDSAPLRILIVDDNASARQIAATLVRSFGWQPTLAEDGEAALRSVDALQGTGQRFDVVFIDWRMPGLDGWTVSERIRSRHGPGNPPLIIMASAHGREALAQRLETEASVIDGFLSKPVTASMLFDAVADARAGVGAWWERNAMSPATARLLGLRVLLVEDNATNQQVARELLAAEGAEVAVAGGGREAVRLLTAHPKRFDAVLMDLQMPDMDGYTATTRIRADLGLVQLPIIAMTANALPSDRDACLSVGMVDHIAKPFDIDQLVQCLLHHARLPTDKTPAVAEVLTAPELHNDFERALARFGNRSNLFARQARSFRQEQQPTLERLADALRRHDPQAAAAEAHGLRGAAALLGAEPLAEAARWLELALLGSGDTALPFEEAVRRLEALRLVHAEACLALEAEADRLQPLLQGAEQPGTATPRPAEFAQLLECLAVNNMRAVSFYPLCRDWLRQQYPEQLDDMDAAIHRLDFAALLKLCQPETPENL